MHQLEAAVRIGLVLLSVTPPLMKSVMESLMSPDDQASGSTHLI